jgi:hypothetical protein
LTADLNRSEEGNNALCLRVSERTLNRKAEKVQICCEKGTEGITKTGSVDYNPYAVSAD